jgi:hypothetical protein
VRFRTAPAVLLLVGACAHAGAPPPAPSAQVEPTTCVLSALAVEPQPLRSLTGFLGGPVVFVKRDDSAETRLAVVRLASSGVAQVEPLPAAFSEAVSVTAVHSVIFQFSIEKQQDRLEVLRRGSSQVVGELEGVGSQHIVDAVDGSDGSSVLAMTKGGGVALLRVEPAGRVSLPTVLVTDHEARSVRLSRDAPGTVLVAWTEQSADRTETSLWFVRASEDGRPLGAPVRIDTAKGAQPVVDVAVAASRQGPVVSWDPIVSHGERGGGDDVVLGVSLRVFASTAGGAFAKAHEVDLTSHAGPVASVGGYVLSNHVKALPLGSDVVLAWENEGRQSASLVSSWNPIDLGASAEESRLVSLGPTEVALISATSVHGDAGDDWPALEEIRLGCHAR